MKRCWYFLNMKYFRQRNLNVYEIDFGLFLDPYREYMLTHGAEIELLYRGPKGKGLNFRKAIKPFKAFK